MATTSHDINATIALSNGDYESDESSINSTFSNTPTVQTPLKQIDDFESDRRPIGKTPSGHSFEVPETHDMVRSLFDPTLRKSVAEVLIFGSLMANIWIYKWLGTYQNRIYGFLGLYAFWRLSYNLGIGILLYKQSNSRTLVEFARSQDLFNPQKRETLLQKLAHLEIKSKMGADYNVDSYPIEFNTWLLFRQFVDLILMQDFTTYMFLVYTAGQDSTLSQSSWLNYTRIILGSTLVLFNLWVKIDAHRVVKDYAWYWGDFFFLEENELIFDGVFNLSPHPMYSIGYIGYYGFALITKSYLVLIVSLVAHFLQFLFLTYVEDPHIEKIYGSDSDEIMVEELEASDHYLKPLVVFNNFNFIRISDYLTVLGAIYTVIGPIFISYGERSWDYYFFGFGLLVKVVQAFITSYVLSKQSSEKFWTKLYLKYGLDNVTAYANWQIIYNFLLVLSYSTFIGTCYRELVRGQYKLGNWLPLRIILGSLMILLQLWTSSSIYRSIGDFGWFYGDFFLPNLSQKALTKSGIYRYLNDPERLLGISGIWGATLITYSPLVFSLAMIWTAHITLFLNFVEKPHMIKVYGEQQVLKNESGVSLTLKQFIPKKLNTTFDSIYNNAFHRVDSYIKKRTQSEINPSGKNVRTALIQQREEILESRSKSDYALTIENLSSNSEIEIGQPIRVKWTAPEGHHPKDWIGLYQVMKTGNSKTITRISSAGKWIATNPDGYNGRDSGIIKRETKGTGGKVTGVVEFHSELLAIEKGVYEIRYHQNDSHKVICLSSPFEIVIPNITINGDLSLNLLRLLKRFQPNLTTNSYLDFKTSSPKFISKLVSDATGVDIASEIVAKLRTVDGIAERLKKSKRILDDLNDPETL